MRHLATGDQRYVGNVGSFVFDDAGAVMAYTVRGQSRLGNGVYLMMLGSGEQKMLDTAAADYDQLTWSEKGTNLAVLRGDKARDRLQKDNVLLAWTNAGTPTARMITVDPAKSSSFPAGHGHQRIHGAAVERGRRARAGGREGAGAGSAGAPRSRRRTWTCGTTRTSSRSRCRSSTRRAGPARDIRRGGRSRVGCRAADRERRHAGDYAERTISSGPLAGWTRRTADRSRGAAAGPTSIASIS